jgi:hypothetical protein
LWWGSAIVAPLLTLGHVRIGGAVIKRNWDRDDVQSQRYAAPYKQTA